jgi:hypothetical protein
MAFGEKWNMEIFIGKKTGNHVHSFPNFSSKPNAAIFRVKCWDLFKNLPGLTGVIFF